jgi:hypothetical protein
MGMHRIRKGAATLMVSLTASALAAAPAEQLLPTGQALTPLAVPGARFTPLVAHIGPHPDYIADGAAAISVSPDAREMLVLTSGFNRYDGPDGKTVGKQSTQYVFRYAIGPSGARRLQTLQVPNSFGGIAWQPDGRGFMVGGGLDDALYVFTRRGSQFVRAGKIPLGHKAGLGAGVQPQAAGVAVSPDGRRALVANYYTIPSASLTLLRGTSLPSRIFVRARSTPRKPASPEANSRSRSHGPTNPTPGSPRRATGNSSPWR